MNVKVMNRVAWIEFHMYLLNTLAYRRQNTDAVRQNHQGFVPEAQLQIL